MTRAVCPYCKKCVVDVNGYCDRYSCNMQNPKWREDKNIETQKRVGE